ncbi:hypothetical protein ACJRO7_012102 [Eucalyptus globulus]|uniref:Uncharacterized protein n=1 Tax=Eucalyptus globulus TaxID=34317 RepID=A0ABD3LHK2_EUCGL
MMISGRGDLGGEKLVRVEHSSCLHRLELSQKRESLKEIQGALTEGKQKGAHWFFGESQKAASKRSGVLWKLSSHRDGWGIISFLAETISQGGERGTL